MGKYKNSICVIILFSIVILLYSCNYKTKKECKEIKIGVALYKKEDTFISTIAQNIEEIAKEKEKEKNIKITLSFVDAQGGLINQGNQIDEFIRQDYDVMCVNLVDRTAASMIIDKAKKSNIPIIFFNREPVLEDMQRWDKLFYVGAKAEQSGIMQGNLIVNEYNNNQHKVDRNGDGKIQYVMLEGEAGHQDTLLRTEYCIKTIVESGIEVEKLADDTANWQTSEAIAKTTRWIKSFGDKIEVVFSNNDDMALGAIHAFNTEKFSGNKPLVVGIDGIPAALEAISNGEMVGTIISDSKAQAKEIFNIAYTLSLGKESMLSERKYAERNIKIPHKLVNSENVNEYLRE